jgi:transporter family protein
MWSAFYFLGSPWEKSEGNILVALLAGVLGSGGAIMFFLALQHGRASLVVPLSALYPAVTILLSFIFLNERPSPAQGLGIFLALVASLLLGM